MGRHLLLNGVYATGASNSIHLPIACTEHLVTINYTDANASISALTIVFQHSADGRDVSDANAVWHTLDTYALSAGEITAKAASIQIMSPPVKRIRVNITTLTGAASADAIYVRYVPYYGGNA